MEIEKPAEGEEVARKIGEAKVIFQKQFKQKNLYKSPNTTMSITIINIVC
jgi:hypothetical protein